MLSQISNNYRKWLQCLSSVPGSFLLSLSLLCIPFFMETGILVMEYDWLPIVNLHNIISASQTLS